MDDARVFIAKMTASVRQPRTPSQPHTISAETIKTLITRYREGIRAALSARKLSNDKVSLTHRSKVVSRQVFQQDLSKSDVRRSQFIIRGVIIEIKSAPQEEVFDESREMP